MLNPIFGHIEYLAHFLSNHYQIKDTLSSAMYKHAPGVFCIISLLCREKQKLADRRAVPCRGLIE
jgi:hypothetical protein